MVATIGSDGFVNTITSDTGTYTLDHDEDGNVTFDKITFRSTGVYEYTIREVAGDDESIVYDDSTYNVTVKVTGGLNKTVTVEKNGEAVSESAIDFNNTTALVEIPEEEPPLSDGEEIIEEEDIPLADVPATGDISVLWAAVAAASGLGLVGLKVFPGKRKDDEEI